MRLNSSCRPAEHLYLTHNFGFMRKMQRKYLCVSRFDLKSCKVLDDVSSDGRLFHVFAAATGKARLPVVQSRVAGICSRSVGVLHNQCVFVLL